MTESDCFIVHSKTQFEFEGKQSMMQDGLLRSANVEIRRKQKSNSAEVEIVFDKRMNDHHSFTINAGYVRYIQYYEWLEHVPC